MYYLKLLLMVCVVLFNFPQTGFSYDAPDISKYEYDRVLFGHGELTTKNNMYAFYFIEPEVEDHTFMGNTTDEMYKQIKDTVEYTGRNYKAGIATLMLGENPVAFIPYEDLVLYIQPEIKKADNGFLLNVCVPNTSNCWDMVITNKSPLAKKLIEDKKLGYEGKVCYIQHSLDGKVLDMFEDYSFTQQNSNIQQNTNTNNTNERERIVGTDVLEVQYFTRTYDIFITRYIGITALVDEITIEKIIVNRGNLEVVKNMFKELPRTLKFGQRFEPAITGIPKEVEIITNLGSMIFTWQ